MKKKKYLIIPIALVTVLIVAFTVRFFKAKRIEKELNDRLYNGPSEEIEYQVGNYVNGGLNVNGYTYIITSDRLLGHYDESGNWIKMPYITMYRVDSNGNYEKFYNFKEDNYTIYLNLTGPHIYYYDGYFYLKLSLFKEGEDITQNYDTVQNDDIIQISDNDAGKTDRIIRISEDGKKSEYIYEINRSFRFGIRDDLLIISYYGVGYNDNGVYYIDLKECMDFDAKEKMRDERIYYEDSKNAFFGESICNDMDNYVSYTDERNGRERQYYKGNVYNIMESPDYEANTLCCKIVDGTDYNVNVVHKNVTCFNIFNDKLYYATYVDGCNEIWVSDMDGSNVEQIYTFDIAKGANCKNIIVSDDNIICDFGPDADYMITDRYIYNRHSGDIGHYTFEE